MSDLLPSKSDRTVHAAYADMEIVRYDRAGKWYLEPTIPGLARQAVPIKEAVQAARWGAQNGGRVFLGRPGGGRFDAMYRRAVA